MTERFADLPPGAPLAIDPTGFPLVWVEAVGAHLQFLPVTKVQFERFLCERASTRFDQAWYEDLLARNDRVTPRKIDVSNYWKAFLTGIKPDEARLFAEWCTEVSDSDDGGVSYGLPSREQWFAAYGWLKGQPPLPPARFDGLPLAPRARVVLRSLSAAVRAGNLAEQMLLRGGVWELLEDRTPAGTRWGSFGLANKALGGYIFDLEKGKPNELPHAETTRVDALGFRLLRRIA